MPDTTPRQRSTARRRSAELESAQPLGSGFVGIVRFFLKRPVTITMLLFALLVVGVIANARIPVQEMPAGLEIKFLVVSLDFFRADAGISPREVEEAITKPMEAELSTLPHLERITSRSRDRNSQIILQFGAAADMKSMYSEVKDRVDRVRAKIEEPLNPPQFWTWDPNDQSVMSYGISWDEDYEGDPFFLIEDKLVPLLENVNGVARVDVEGMVDSYIRIEMKADEIARHNLSTFAINSALRGDNFTMAAGTVADGESEYFVVSDARFRSIDDIKSIPISADVTLGQVAHVFAARELRSQIVRIGDPNDDTPNSRPAVEIEIYKTAEANTVALCKTLHAAIEKRFAEDRTLDAFSYTTFSNEGGEIENSINTLKDTVLGGAICAFIILFFFLRRVRLTVLIAAVIPMSLTGALIAMFFMGESINLLTLMGFTLATGMLVDNAIVVTENIARYRDVGLKPPDAAAFGAGEVALAVILSTLTSVAVFLPIVFMSGEMMSFFLGRIGMPLCFSLIGSLVAAVLFVPIATVLVFREPPEWFKRRTARAKQWIDSITPLRASLAFVVLTLRSLDRAADGLVAWARGSYLRLLRLALSHRFLTVSFVSMFVALTMWAIMPGPERGDSLVMIDFKRVIDTSRDKLDIDFGRARIEPKFVETDEETGDTTQRIAEFEEDPETGRRQISKINGLGLLRMTDFGETRPRHITIRYEMPAETSLEEAFEIFTELEVALEDLINTPYEFDRAAPAVSPWARPDPDAPPIEPDLVERPGLPVRYYSSSFRDTRGRLRLNLDLDAGWNWTQTEITDRLKAHMPQRPGVTMRIGWGGGGGRAGGGAGGETVSLLVSGPDTEVLADVAEDLAARLESIEGLENVTVETERGRDEIRYVMDRELLRAYDADPTRIAQTLSYGLNGTTLSNFQTEEGRDIPVRVLFEKTRDDDSQTVENFSVPTADGGTMPFKTVVSQDPEFARGLGTINRENRKTSLQITANTSEDLDTMINRISGALRDYELPRGYSWDPGERLSRWRSDQAQMEFAVVAALVLVFLIMGFFFESVFLPWTVLVTIPLAFIGVVWGLIVTDTAFGMVVGVGCVILVGLVVNNGIVMIDLINRLIASGMSRRDALIEAGRHRFRPIVMTAMTTIVGLIPMAIGDANLFGTPYAPIGRAVIGGLFSSTVLTLVILPVAYTIFDDMRKNATSLFESAFGWRLFGRKRRAASTQQEI